MTHRIMAMPLDIRFLLWLVAIVHVLDLVFKNFQRWWSQRALIFDMVLPVSRSILLARFDSAR